MCAIKSYLITINRHGHPTLDHTGLSFPATFREHSPKLNTKCYILHILFICSYVSAISPTRTVNLCYTRISALHRKDSCLALPIVTIIATITVYWLILHWSVYYLSHKTVALILIITSTTS